MLNKLYETHKRLMRPGVVVVVKSRNRRAQTNPPHNTFSMVLYQRHEENYAL